jgi:tetratricopeptide (TPR) repeat protein
LVVDSKTAVASDRQQLARLYEAEGKLELARQQYLKLLSRDDPSAAQMISYIELLLRHDLYGEADPWLKRLETTLPDHLGAAALRACWLHGTKQDGKIEPLVEPLAAKLVKKAPANKQRQADLAMTVGSLYSAADQQQAAERWYRRLVGLMPDRYQPLANALAQQGRTREAIELCRNAAQSDHSPRPALALAMVLLTGKPAAEDFQLAETVLTKAAADHKDDVNLLFAVASVRVVQRRPDEAIRLYRQVVALKPTHVTTLNNLATLLAEQPEGRREAIECVDRAMQIVGPQPGLLDTKGMILVLEGKPDDAVPLLQEAAATPQSDPRYHFHLAVAYDRSGEAKKARDALETARKGNLTRQVLTQSDRQMLADLEKKFGR